MWEQRVRLKNESESSFVRRNMYERRSNQSSTDANITAHHTLETCDHSKRRGLTHATRTEQTDRLAIPHHQVEVAQNRRLFRVIPGRNAFEMDDAGLLA